jgi:hypothetical protein
VWESKENSFPETINRLATDKLTTERHCYTPKLGGIWILWNVHSIYDLSPVKRKL